MKRKLSDTELEEMGRAAMVAARKAWGSTGAPPLELGEQHPWRHYPAEAVFKAIKKVFRGHLKEADWKLVYWSFLYEMENRDACGEAHPFSVAGHNLRQAARIAHLLGAISP